MEQDLNLKLSSWEIKTATPSGQYMEQDLNFNFTSGGVNTATHCKQYIDGHSNLNLFFMKDQNCHHLLGQYIE